VKIMAIADIHLRGGHETDEAQALMRAASIANEREVDLVLVNGDVFEAKSTPAQRLVFRDFLKAMESLTLVLRGNHDEAGDLKVFDLDGATVVHEEPFVERYPFSQGGEYHVLQVLTIPHFNAGAVALQSESLGSTNETGTNLFDALLDDYFQKVRAHAGPSIVAFHGTVSGAALDNGHIPRENGIHLNLHRLAALGCPVVGGHYHRCQNVAAEIGGQVWYSGSATRQTYGESEGDKGVLIFEWADGAWKEPEFVSLNPVPMVLVEADWHGPGAHWTNWQGPREPEAFAGARVRFRYNVEREYYCECQASDLKQTTFRLAREVKLDPQPIISTAVRSEAITQVDTVPDCVRVYLESKGLPGEQVDEALALLAEVTAEEPLLAPLAAV